MDHNYKRDLLPTMPSRSIATRDIYYSCDRIVIIYIICCVLSVAVEIQ